MNQIVKQVYANEMTEKGLAELRQKYPEDLKLEISDDNVFKAARKTRTEKNKLVEALNRRRLDVTGEIKKYGDSLIEQIESIYDVVVLPFEKEDKVRKDKAAEEARKLEELLNKERAQIKEIHGFVDMCRGEDSKFIQGKIEAVDLIETDIFHKDVIHEAIEAKKQTLVDLSQLLSDTIIREKVEVEREELRVKQAEADEKLRKAAADHKITDRINALRMKPTDFIGKSSTVVNAQIVSLSRFMVTKEEFGDRMSEVNTVVELVISQLELIRTQAEQMEYIDKVEADKKAELEKVELPVEDSEPEPSGMLCGTYEKEPVDDVPIEQTEDAPILNSHVSNIKGFLEWSSSDRDSIEDFGHLLISDDPNHNAEALDSIRENFKTYCED